MEENDIEYFLSGGNFALESILQTGNTHDAYDKKHILDIYKKFGLKKIDNLPIISKYERYVKLPKRKKIITLYPLDYLDYNRDRALLELSDFCGFQYYGAKHWESVFTKFMQTYYLYKKFGVDKRKSHFSSMIISGQMTRNNALKELESMPYEEISIKEDIKFICDKLGITIDEMFSLINLPSKHHNEYEISYNLWIYPLEIINRIRLLINRNI